MDSRPVRVFYSYAEQDEGYQKALETHLALMQRHGLIKPWHRRNIKAGSGLGEEVDRNLDQADLVLLLVSADFFASDHCTNDVTKIKERQQTGKVTVIPILVRPVGAIDLAPFAALKSLPDNGIPVSSWDKLDEAWENVANGIRQVVEATVESSVREVPRPAVELESKRDQRRQQDVSPPRQPFLPPIANPVKPEHHAGDSQKTPGRKAFILLAMVAAIFYLAYEVDNKWFDRHNQWFDLGMVSENRTADYINENTDYHRYCKEPPCHVLIYGSQNSDRFKNAIVTYPKTIDHKPKEARLTINATFADIGKNAKIKLAPIPSNCHLIVSVNYQEKPSSIPINDIPRGRPLYGPFENFETRTYPLPHEATENLLANVKNFIAFSLQCDDYQWIVMQWSQLHVR